MINSELLAVLPKSEGPGSFQGPFSSKDGIPLQLAEYAGFNFEDALMSQIPLLPGQDITVATDGIQLSPLALPEGKDLPLLPQLDIAAETGTANLGEPGTIISLEEEAGKILIASPVILGEEARREPLQEVDITLPVQALKKDDQGLQPRIEMQKTDSLMDATIAKGSVNRIEVNSGSVELLSTASAQTSDRPVDAASTGTINANTKLAPVDSSSQPGNIQKLSIGIPVQHASWADNLAGRVSYMLMNNQHSAQISLNPADLGPIEVKVSLHNDQAHVNFYAHNASVRDAIEEAFPRLRDMLGENGLNLSQTSVSDQSLSQRQAQGEASTPEYPGYPFVDEAEAGEHAVSNSLVVKMGLVDHFV